MLTELILGSPAAPRLRYVCLIAAGFAVETAGRARTLAPAQQTPCASMASSQPGALA